MNPYTRMAYGSVSVTVDNTLAQSMTANGTGVTGPTDDENVTLHVKGDMSVSNRLHVDEALADSWMNMSDKNKKKNIKHHKPAGPRTVSFLIKLAGRR